MNGLLITCLALGWAPEIIWLGTTWVANLISFLPVITNSDMVMGCWQQRSAWTYLGGRKPAVHKIPRHPEG